MKESTLDTLGSQMISNEIAIISMLQVLVRAEPALGQALVQALRENNSRVPSSFQCARDRIERYVELLQQQIPTQSSEPAATRPAIATLRKRA